MPHRGPVYEIKLPVGINKQYLLSLIPVLGFFISNFTCLINIRHINRSSVFSWWIQSCLPIIGSCLLLALLIWLCAIFFEGVFFVVLAAIATYMVLVGMAFVMIFVEKKVIVKECAKATKDKLDDEQEVE